MLYHQLIRFLSDFWTESSKRFGVFLVGFTFECYSCMLNFSLLFLYFSKLRLVGFRRSVGHSKIQSWNGQFCCSGVGSIGIGSDVLFHIGTTSGSPRRDHWIWCRRCNLQSLLRTRNPLWKSRIFMVLNIVQKKKRFYLYIQSLGVRILLIVLSSPFSEESGATTKTTNIITTDVYHTFWIDYACV